MNIISGEVQQPLLLVEARAGSRIGSHFAEKKWKQKIKLKSKTSVFES